MTTAGKHSVVFSGQDNLWDETPKVIAYYFMQGTQIQRTKVRDVIEEWTYYASAVFREVNKPEQSNVRIKFDPNDGSWSYVGRQRSETAITDATMNLAWIDESSPLTPNERAVILHEFGRVLGPTATVHSAAAAVAPAPAAIPIPVPVNSVGSPSTGQGSFVRQLRDKLSSLYCSGGAQYFSLQFPTRFLDKEKYAYKLDAQFSRTEKPIVVNEAEFSLTNSLYDVAPIVGGPNGQMLSKNYEKAINSLIPTFESKEVRQQREKMRAWLVKETKSGGAAYTIDTRLSLPGISAQSAKELSDLNGVAIIPGGDQPLADQNAAKAIAQQAIDKMKSTNRTNPKGMTRMEFSDSLMQAYLNDRKTWELEKDAMIKEASEKATSDPAAMEKMTRKLAQISAIEEAKLASKYSDAVVRGYSHTVRGFMGHLDTKSTGESLQGAKDAFRQSAISSVYTASHVYPVTMQPSDWFEALDSSLTREDLSQNSQLATATVKAEDRPTDTIEQQTAKNEESRWSETQIISTISNDWTGNESRTSTSLDSFQCNFWLRPSSNEPSSPNVSPSSRALSSMLKVDVSMRTTYVTVDRSEWFNPSLLGMSKSFMRGNLDTHHSSWSTWPTGENSQDAIQAIKNNDSTKPSGYFPCFPVGYVLVKDIVIQVTSDASDSSAFKSHFDRDSESSGGFLCFSHRSNSRSSSDSDSSITEATKDGVIVRVPGPQILGYIMQLNAVDQSQPFATLPAGDLFLEHEDNIMSGEASARSDVGEGKAPIRAPTNSVRMQMQTPTNPSTPSSHLQDALQTALGDADGSKWFDSQPDGAKEELWARLQQAFGKVGR